MLGTIECISLKSGDYWQVFCLNCLVNCLGWLFEYTLSANCMGGFKTPLAISLSSFAPHPVLIEFLHLPQPHPP